MNPDIFETAYNCFYPGSCGRGLKPIWRTVSQQCGFAERIHWFSVDGKPTRAKRYTVEKIPRYVDVASGGRDAEIEFP